MANSQYTYVRDWEQPDHIPRGNWIVVRLDGRGFTKLTQRHNFAKPNDKRALELMNAAAVEVVRSLPDIVLAYGQSDEYSLVFAEGTSLFERRREKLVSTVASTFTAEYCILWPNFMGSPLTEADRPLPSFDGRVVVYPKKRLVRDYLAWRQVDCHINNLYNTTFWALVLKGGMSGTEAEERLKGTVSGDKNEILFGQFGINYNEEDVMFRKGSVVYREMREKPRVNGADDPGAKQNVDVGGMVADAREHKKGGKAPDPSSKTQLEKEKRWKKKATIVVEHVDIIKDDFWTERPWILKSAYVD